MHYISVWSAVFSFDIIKQVFYRSSISVLMAVQENSLNSSQFFISIYLRRFQKNFICQQFSILFPSKLQAKFHFFNLKNRPLFYPIPLLTRANSPFPCLGTRPRFPQVLAISLFIQRNHFHSQLIPLFYISPLFSSYFLDFDRFFLTFS